MKKNYKERYTKILDMINSSIEFIYANGDKEVGDYLFARLNEVLIKMEEERI